MSEQTKVTTQQAREVSDKFDLECDAKGITKEQLDEAVIQCMPEFVRLVRVQLKLT